VLLTGKDVEMYKIGIISNAARRQIFQFENIKRLPKSKALLMISAGSVLVPVCGENN
jgi:hypothetical protein